MRHFISFQKRKGLYLVNDNSQANPNHVNAIVVELAKYGYVVSAELKEVLSTQSVDKLTEVYSDLCKGLRFVVGEDKYEPIYKNFPQSVQNITQFEYVLNAILYYWTNGQFEPDAVVDPNRPFALETGKMVEVSLLNQTQFDNILFDLVYGGDSISNWDKQIIDWFIANTDLDIDLNNIKFKETKAYVAKAMLDNSNVTVLPMRSATDVLRSLAAYSGGDEGLKANTKFKQLTSRQKKVVLATLDNCFDLEESFKVYREVWLRVLFYLNPMTKSNAAKYSNVARYANLLRNTPGVLKTFNSKVESLISSKDKSVFDLLSKRKGVFMRRLNQLVTVFGIDAVNKFISTNPTFDQLITVYNYFADRSEEKQRAAVLAGSQANNLVTYEGLKALPKDLITSIQISVRNAISRTVTRKSKVFIDKSLYYRPVATNNRGSSLSLDGRVIGTVEQIADAKTVRAYVHWSGRSDIDLSGFIIYDDGRTTKVGWNGRGHDGGTGVTYSGDNTGTNTHNAEYLDVDMELASLSNAEWVVLECRVFRGQHFCKWGNGKVRAGWQLVDHPQANTHWTPSNVANAMVIESDSKAAYLSAVHIPTHSIVYLDLAIKDVGAVSTSGDALKVKAFLDKFISGGDTGGIDWTKIKQGHVIELLSSEVVDDPQLADIVFDDNTPWEKVSRLITEQTL